MIVKEMLGKSVASCSGHEQMSMLSEFWGRNQCGVRRGQTEECEKHGCKELGGWDTPGWLAVLP